MNLKTTIAKGILKKVIEKRLDKSDVPVSGHTAEVAADKAAEAAAPVLVNATNNEPWYQSRVTLGSGFVVLTSVGTIGGMLSGAVEFDVAVLAANLATILGAAFALYGRWKAKKPLGQ